MFPARILTRLVSRQYLCSFDRKKVDFDFTKDFVKLLKTFVGKLRQIEAKFLRFQGDFIAGAMQEFFGSYDAPPYTVENTFEVDGQKVKIS